MLKLTVWQRIVIGQIAGQQQVSSVGVMRQANAILDLLDLTDSDKLVVGWSTEPGHSEVAPNGELVTVPEKATWQNGDYQFEINFAPAQEVLIRNWVSSNSWPAGSWSNKNVRRQILALYDQLGLTDESMEDKRE